MIGVDQQLTRIRWNCFASAPSGWNTKYNSNYIVRSREIESELRKYSSSSIGILCSGRERGNLYMMIIGIRSADPVHDRTFKMLSSYYFVDNGRVLKFSSAY